MSLRYIKFGLFLAASGNFQVHASPVSLPPVDIPVGPDSQVRIAISNTDPNLFVVPGDRIIAVDSVQGMFVNANKAQGQANGGGCTHDHANKALHIFLTHGRGTDGLGYRAAPEKTGPGAAFHFRYTCAK